MQEFELSGRDCGGATTGPKPGAEERFVGIDVSNTAQQFLIEQRTLDGCLTAAKQCDKSFFFYFQWLDAARFELSRAMHAQPAEAPRVDETKFTPGCQFGDRMSMLHGLGVRIADRHAALHPEM